MTQIVKNENYDYTVLDAQGRFVGYLDHKGEPFLVAKAVYDVSGDLIGLQNSDGSTASIGGGGPALIPANNLADVVSPPVAKANLGLGNVDNTADDDKPVSTDQQLALNAKAATAYVDAQVATRAGLVATPISYSTAIPLDTLGAGKQMASHQLVANSTFTVGASPVEGGSCTFALVGDGSHTPNLSAFTIANGYSYSNTAGANNIYAAIYQYGSALLFGILGTPVTVPPVFSAQSAPAGQVGTPYSYTFVASGATGFAVASGSLPAGITLNAGTGVISGTPTTAATSTFTISATNLAGTTTSSGQSVLVTPASPVFTSQSAPDGEVGTPYTYTFVATGAVSYAVASGSLPAGVTLNTSTGVISGTPTTENTYTFAISATNAGGTTTSTGQSVDIEAALSGGLSFATVDGYNHDLTDTPEYDDWYVFRSQVDGGDDFRKNHPDIINGPTFDIPGNREICYLAVDGPTLTFDTADAWDVGNDAPAGFENSNTGQRGGWISTTDDEKIRLAVLPANIAPAFARICVLNVGGVDGETRLRATLSDGSHAAITQALPANQGASTSDYKFYDLTFNAGSNGQTVAIDYEIDTAVNSPWAQLCFIAYGVGAPPEAP